MDGIERNPIILVCFTHSLEIFFNKPKRFFVVFWKKMYTLLFGLDKIPAWFVNFWKVCVYRIYIFVV